MADLGSGLASGAGDFRGDLRRCLHDEVAQSAGDLDVFRAERDAYPLFGVVVVVDRVVTPPGAIVVPDAAVGIEVLIFHAPTSSQGVGHPLSHARVI